IAVLTRRDIWDNPLETSSKEEYGRMPKTVDGDFRNSLAIVGVLTLLITMALAFGTPRSIAHADDAPKASDPRLVVELFAAAPDIVHPANIAFDKRGRLLVIESHTHFRPRDYQGPRHDRVRVLEDTDGDGRADRFTTFYEGTRATMDIAVHPDGSVYLATL